MTIWYDLFNVHKWLFNLIISYKKIFFFSRAFENWISDFNSTNKSFDFDFLRVEVEFFLNVKMSKISLLIYQSSFILI